MSLYINTAIVGTIALIMIFTYTAEFVFFADDTELGNVLAGKNYGEFLSFNDWFNEAYNYTKNIQLTNPVIQDVFGIENSNTYFTIAGVRSIYNSKYNREMFNDYKTGYDFYNGKQPDGSPLISATAKNNIKTDYKSYLKPFGFDIDEAGVLKTYQKNFVEQAIDFLGKIPQSFGKFLEIVSFTIKDTYGSTIIPAPVVVVLNIFFIPMWIVLLVEILPVLAMIIGAIGSLIPF